MWPTNRWNRSKSRLLMAPSAVSAFIWAAIAHRASGPPGTDNFPGWPSGSPWSMWVFITMEITKMKREIRWLDRQIDAGQVKYFGMVLCQCLWLHFAHACAGGLEKWVNPSFGWRSPHSPPSPHSPFPRIKIWPKGLDLVAIPKRLGAAAGQIKPKMSGD